MPAQPTIVYLCPNCFSADPGPGLCPACDRERVACDPGDPDNPCRRPPMDADGRLQSRAPLWWLVRSAPFLRARLARRQD
jgi:hypothetical protein